MGLYDLDSFLQFQFLLFYLRVTWHGHQLYVLTSFGINKVLDLIKQSMLTGCHDAHLPQIHFTAAFKKQFTLQWRAKSAPFASN